MNHRRLWKGDVLSKDQAIGGAILLGSMAGIIVYGWLLYSYAMIVLQLTAFVAVAAVLVILAWIGWTMATTPPLEPIEPEVTTPAGEEASSKAQSE
jgi:predicted DNA-binding transcriptional regulator